MEKQTVFVKRYHSKGEFPKCKGYSYRVYVITNNGIVYYDKYDGWEHDIEWWFEEIELPSEDDMDDHLLNHRVENRLSVKRGMNFILNKLKGDSK